MKDQISVQRFLKNHELLKLFGSFLFILFEKKIFSSISGLNRNFFKIICTYFFCKQKNRALTFNLKTNAINLYLMKEKKTLRNLEVPQISV